MTEARIPSSTYRLQFGREMRFVDARDLVPYLHSLGVGDLYASPLFTPRRGSTHGYDIANPWRVNSELGMEEEFAELGAKLGQYRMGLVLDIVPNHMAASHENGWWMDVLEHGPSSPYAKYFDINWQPVTTKAKFLQENRVLLPVLGDLYGRVLERREFSLSMEDTGFVLRYFERRFPLDAKTYGPLLELALEKLEARGGGETESYGWLKEALALAGRIPARTETGTVKVKRRRKLAGEVKGMVFREYRDEPEARAAIDEAMRELEGSGAEPKSTDRLHAMLDAQAYRLASWRIAFEEINYRRFFDINDLVRLRVEDKEVFEDRHQTLFEMIRAGAVTGMRVDHIDGLYEPAAYLRRLQAGAVGRKRRGGAVYTVVEKILGRDEKLPDGWAVWGTTGYEFLNALNDLYVQPEGLALLEERYREFTGRKQEFAALCRERNKQVMQKLFSGDAIALGYELARLAAHDREARDVPVTDLTKALVEVTACLPVYRTYITEEGADRQAREQLERAFEEARRLWTEVELSTPALEFLKRVLTGEPAGYSADLRPQYLEFAMRWQQLTAPVMAKGVEDTAFYVHNALISRNEVGGDPLREKPPRELGEFHAMIRERFVRWPHTMNATTTHDAKRSEDTRARINVLTEVAEEWWARVEKWSGWNEAHKTETGGRKVPTRNEEILLYQSLVGVWPLEEEDAAGLTERMKQFVLKAAREAKDYTGWIRQDEAHEAALLRFTERVLEAGEENRFLEDLRDIAERVALHGALNSLSQLTVKLMAPGVPDFYQGTELWSCSLVDPDNRRAVDFRRRAAMLDELRRGEQEGVAGMMEALAREWRDGRIKMFVMRAGLEHRRANAERFERADYLELAVEGERAQQVIAFARRMGEWWTVAAAPRWTVGLVEGPGLAPGAEAWGDTRIVLPEGAPRRWRDVLRREEMEGAGGLELGRICGAFPVAVLESADQSR